MKLQGISENGLKRIASKIKGQDATQQIVQYLTENGEMSAQDIINDLGLDEAAVSLAEQAGLIQQVQPLSGGGGTWYKAASRKRAAFMEPEIEYGEWYNIDGSAGMFSIPEDLVGDVDLAEEEREGFPSFEDYHEGNEIYEVEKVTGYGARLSAPGYMDATEWVVFDTQKEAEDYLEEMYGDEDF